MSYLEVLLPLARQSLREPRESAATLLSVGVPKSTLWPAFFLLVMLSTLLLNIQIGGPVVENAPTPPPPFLQALMSAAISLTSVLAVWKIGRGFGGTGTFDEALLLTVFLQAIFLVLQGVVVAVGLFVFPLAVMLYVGLVVFGVWLNVNFIAALHGFASLWKSFCVLVLASFAALLVYALLLMYTGTGVPDV